jgi:hypothetical protein
MTTRRAPILSAKHRLRSLATALGLAALVAGCGGQPMPFPAPQSELGERPGLLTGPTGSFDVLNRDSSREQTH